MVEAKQYELRFSDTDNRLILVELQYGMEWELASGKSLRVFSQGFRPPELKFLDTPIKLARSGPESWQVTTDALINVAAVGVADLQNLNLAEHITLGGEFLASNQVVYQLTDKSPDFCMFQHFKWMQKAADLGVASGAASGFDHYRLVSMRKSFFDLEMLRGAFDSQSCTKASKCGCRPKFLRHVEKHWGMDPGTMGPMLGQPNLLKDLDSYLWDRVIARAQAARKGRLPVFTPPSQEVLELTKHFAELTGNIFSKHHKSGHTSQGESILMFASGVGRMGMSTTPILDATQTRREVPSTLFNAEANGRDITLLCELAAVAEESKQAFGGVLPYLVVGIHLMYKTYGTVNISGKGPIDVNVKVLEHRLKNNRDPRPTVREFQAWTARASEVAERYGDQNQRILESVWGATLYAGEIQGIPLCFDPRTDDGDGPQT